MNKLDTAIATKLSLHLSVTSVWLCLFLFVFVGL